MSGKSSQQEVLACQVGATVCLRTFDARGNLLCIALRSAEGVSCFCFAFLLPVP